MIEIKIPSVGESISEGTIGKWLVKTGDQVKTDQPILELETDKASVEVVAPANGVLTLIAKAGETVKIGQVVAQLAEGQGSQQVESTSNVVKPSAPTEKIETASALDQSGPAVRKLAQELNVNPSTGTGRDGRLTKSDVMNSAASPVVSAAPAVNDKPAVKNVAVESKVPLRQLSDKRVKMTTIRKKIAERLHHSQKSTATLTTFNEIDMGPVMELRKKYKEIFLKKHGVNLGFMSFFTKAVIEALYEFPQINGFIEGDEVVYKGDLNIGIAVGTDKGLMVPVIKKADHLSFAGIEKTIAHFAQKARDGKISIDDLDGGTFTISNGGVYGSLLSTPILNPPQSGILGLHKIEDRPVVVNGQIVIKSMMYVAFSYDHRLIDGSESVRFLVKIKECMEDPQRILLEL